MDNAGGGLGGPGGPQGQWGRPDPKIGAIVDDNTKTVWAKGLGWVNDRGDVYTGGQWFPADGHHADARDPAMQAAAKAKALFGGGGGPGPMGPGGPGAPNTATGAEPGAMPPAAPPM